MERVVEDRVWASQWYRVTPRSFVHEELFFDPNEVLRIFAGESYKSLLLRKDGREKAAKELGEQYRSVAADRLRTDDDVTVIGRETLEAIELKSGSWLRKPRLIVDTTDRTYTYYHQQKRHDVGSLGEQLRTQYQTVPVRVDGETR